MQVNKINSVQSFRAEGSNESSNSGKLIGTGVAAGLIAQKVIQKGSFKDYFQTHKNKVAEELKKECKLATPPAIDTPFGKRLAAFSMAADFGLIALCGIGGGTALDFLLNSRRSN